MAYRLRYSVNIDWIPDGAGGMTVPSAQTLQFQGAQPIAFVPGGDSPTGANLTTACTTMGTDISTQMNVAAVLSRIQGFSTGGG